MKQQLLFLLLLLFPTFIFAQIGRSPADGVTEVSLTPQFNWDEIPGAQVYQLQIDDNEDFSSPVLTENGINNTTHILQEPLEINTTYYWQIISNNGDSLAVYSFTTIAEEPEISSVLTTLPAEIVIDEGNSVLIRGQVEIPQTTFQAGETEGLQAWIGLSTTDTNPATWDETSWQPATYSTESSSYEVYEAVVGSTSESGQYYFAYRFQYNEQTVYAGLGDFWNSAINPSGQIRILGLPNLNLPASGSVIESSPLLEWTNDDTSATGYNIQLSTNSGFPEQDIVIEDSTNSTSFEVSENVLNDTTYYWRVQAQYDVPNSSWSDPFSFTYASETTPILPDSIVLISPTNGADSVSLQPTFTWNEDPASDNYRLQVSTESDSTLVVDNSEVPTAAFSVNQALEYGTNYFWRVRGINGESEGVWSEERSFATFAPETNLLSPENEATGLPQEVQLVWSDIADVTTYDIQLSENSQFADFVIDSTVTDTSLNVTDLAFNQTYYWQIRANYADHYSEWTNGTFTTQGQAPDAPELLSPDNEQDEVELITELSWSSSSGAELYIVQLSSQPNFSQSSLVLNDTLAQTSISTPQLTYDDTYFWKVKSYSSSGGYSDWSTPFSFRTIPDVPDAVTLISPEDNLSDIGSPVTFSWSSSSGADYYQIQIVDDDNIRNPVVEENAYSTDNLDPGMEYSWRVRAIKDTLLSEWSNYFTFETGVSGFRGPQLIAPQRNANNVGTSVLLIWNEIRGADAYQLQVSNDPEFNEFVVNEADLANTEFTVNNLEHAISYYWRVRAVDDNGESRWSSVYNFGTEVETPSVPFPLSPEHESEDISLPVTLTWQPAARADRYELLLSEHEDLSSPVIDEELTDTSFTANSLENQTQYYWQITAINNSGTSESGIQTFSTIVELPAKPSLINPEDQSETETTVSFSWDEVEHAESYTLQISTLDSFNDIVIDSSGITDNAIDITNLDEGTTYYWRVRSQNRAGASDWSDERSFITQKPTSIEEETLPDDFALYQNYPNPFNPTTTINYDIKEASNVRLNIYDISGRLVHTLVNEHQSAGKYSVTLDGRGLASGIYIMRMQSSDFVATKKLTLIK